ncbi:MAG TPA: hypothetical protein PLH31_08665 [Caulobacter sp.]|nr:hypothetical protein [Caulobacter sp.]
MTSLAQALQRVSVWTVGSDDNNVRRKSRDFGLIEKRRLPHLKGMHADKTFGHQGGSREIGVNDKHAHELSV